MPAISVSPRLQLTHAWITGLNEKNLDRLASLSAEDFISTIRPASLGIKPVGKKEYLERLGSAPIETFNIALPKTGDIIETEEVIQFYTTADGRTAHGFEWKNEYMFTFRFTEDGKLIRSVTEFVDPTVVTTAFSKEAVVAEAQAQSV
ncbi:hypothetical protein H0H81_009425 [Sphagnurus paluster]|uniref:SnoaL-like domain-containing protein n=1 Tax=Sphagnurus paluster TaxID=117069 RepID=A0A9P7K411_9AGAR|nr:hypothetical protein H0H81_009425 [Sphagnurus paluster]